jgi:hypothetical protein
MGEHFKTYDMDDVWNIVFPTDVAAGPNLKVEAGKAVTKNLFMEYANIDIKDVAASNEWYHSYTDNDSDDRSNQMHTNLLWMYQFLKNNVEPVMLTRLIQKHDRFPDMQQGGTLLFALLMRELLFTTEAAFKNLAEQMKNYKINKVPGEDVKAIAAAVLSTSRRIWYSKKEKFPEDFVNDILELYTTSSVLEFNAHFVAMQTKIATEEATEQVKSLTGDNTAVTRELKNDLETIELLCNLAQKFYDRYKLLGVCAKHIKNRAPVEGLNATMLDSPGQKGHVVKECPHKLNEEQVNKRRQAYLEEKKKRKPAQNVLTVATLVVAEVRIVVTAAQQVEVDAVVADLHPPLREALNGLLPKKERMASSSFGPTTWENNHTSGILK